MISDRLTEKITDLNASESKQGKLLSPFQRKLLLANLEKDLRPEYIRRVKIMLLADLGHSQTEICQALNCSQETARYWIFMARSGQAHKWKELALGRPKTIDDEYLSRLKELVNQSPQNCGYAFSNWTAYWLKKQLAKEFSIEISERHIYRLLKKMGLSTRPKQFQKDKQEKAQKDNNSIVISNLSHNSEPESVNFRLFPASK